MNLIETIAEKLSSISRPKRKFLVILLSTIHIFRGKMTFRNLARYSSLSEKTYARRFHEGIDFRECNGLALKSCLPSESVKTGAMDATFSAKSGKNTYGIDNFYHSSNNKAEKGLEFSELAIVDVDYNTAYHYSTKQTPDKERLQEILGPESSRIDWYLAHLQEDADALKSFGIRHLTLDGYYAKKKFVAGACEAGLHVISRLRKDANLRYLYIGPREKRRGRPRQYYGKMNVSDLSCLTPVPVSNTVTLYTGIVNSVNLKRNIKLVHVMKKTRHKVMSYLLFSTDLSLSAEDIYRYYTSRFQIEFLFRDAKQFTGFIDFQTREKNSIDSHVNASMTALNFLKLEDRIKSREDTPHVISIYDWKLRKFNEHMINLFISILDSGQNYIKNHTLYEKLTNYGTVGA